MNRRDAIKLSTLTALNVAVGQGDIIHSSTKEFYC